MPWAALTHGSVTDRAHLVHFRTRAIQRALSQIVLASLRHGVSTIAAVAKLAVAEFASSVEAALWKFDAVKESPPNPPCAPRLPQTRIQSAHAHTRRAADTCARAGAARHATRRRRLFSGERLHGERRVRSRCRGAPSVDAPLSSSTGTETVGYAGQRARYRAITRRLACHSALRLRTPLSSHRRGPWVDLSQHWGPPHGGAGVRPCLCANSNAARHVSHGWQRRHARRSIRRPSEWCAGMNGCDGQPTSPPIWIATSSLQVSHSGNVSHRQGIPPRHAARHPTAPRYPHPARRCALRGIAPMSEFHARRSSLSVA